jgi:hypothetical protein
MKTLIAVIVSMLLIGGTGLAEDIRTVVEAEARTNDLPTADYIVTIENHEVECLDANNIFEFMGGIHLKRMPQNIDDMRRLTLGFMLEVNEHYHLHGMFTIITDEYPSPLEYKAYVKRFTPENITKVVK